MANKCINTSTKNSPLKIHLTVKTDRPYNTTYLERLKVLPQLFFPIRHVESGCLELGQVKRRVGRTRRDGALGIRVIISGADRHDPVAVAVGGLEDGPGDIGPGPHGAGAGAVVGAVGGVRAQNVEDGLGHVAREGQAAQLVVHDGDPLQLVLRVGDAVGEPLHGLHEVVSLADDPGAAHDVVVRASRHGDVAGGLGLAVD